MCCRLNGLQLACQFASAKVHRIAWSLRVIADNSSAVRVVGTQQRVRYILHLRRQSEGRRQRLLPRYHPHSTAAAFATRRLQHHRRTLRNQGLNRQPDEPETDYFWAPIT